MARHFEQCRICSPDSSPISLPSFASTDGSLICSCVPPAPTHRNGTKFSDTLAAHSQGKVSFASSQRSRIVSHSTNFSIVERWGQPADLLLLSAPPSQISVAEATFSKHLIDCTGNEQQRLIVTVAAFAPLQTIEVTVAATYQRSTLACLGNSCADRRCSRPNGPGRARP